MMNQRAVAHPLRTRLRTFGPRRAKWGSLLVDSARQFASSRFSTLQGGSPMVRMICLPILILVATVGCATRLVPTPLPDSPKEYRWSPFKWKPGVTLTYNERHYTGQKIGDREVNNVSRSVLQMRGIEETAGGIVRVQLSVDGTALGFFMVDEAGRVVDAVASSPEVGEVFKDSLPIEIENQQAFSKVGVLRVGEIVRVEYSRVRGMARWPHELRDAFKQPVVVNYEFIGYAMFGEKMVVGFRGETHDILKSTVWGSVEGSQERYQINTMTQSGSTYYDPVGGFRVVEYSVGTASGLFKNQHTFIRRVKRSELDWKNSSGF